MRSVAAPEDAPRVSLIGLGRLGLCMGLVLERAGFSVLGCNITAKYVESINTRTLTSREPGVGEGLRRAVRLRATLSLEEAVDWSDLIFILVATPTGIGEHAYDCGKLSQVLPHVSGRPSRAACPG